MNEYQAWLMRKTRGIVVNVDANDATEAAAAAWAKCGMPDRPVVAMRGENEDGSATFDVNGQVMQVWEVQQ